MGMPHFYFQIRDRERIIVDEEGLDLPDVEAATLEARSGGLHMLKDAMADGDDITHQIVEVTDSQGHIVATVALQALLGGVPDIYSGRARFTR